MISSEGPKTFILGNQKLTNTMSELVEFNSVTTTTNGQVPKRTYTVRFRGGKASKSGKGFRQIEAKFEIITPDIVDLPAGGQTSVAGRQGTIYLTYDPTSKASSDTRLALDRLGLLTADKKLDVDAAVEQLKSGNLFAEVLLDSKERIERDAFGNTIMVDGRPMTNGWEFTYISANAIAKRAEAIDGLPPVPQEQSVNAPY